MKNTEAICKNFPHFLHGGDYNPEQWLESPEILEQDMELMKASGCNTMTLNMFAWATIEPEEGKYDFSYLDMMMDKIYQNGGRVILGTPSGARPAWLAEKYPEVLRVTENGLKNLFGSRHNHCYTSKLYREKTAQINRALAERYKNHPALIMWHLSNEYGGECHCEKCQEAFREWLKQKYDNDLDKLNFQYWNRFWSHTFTSWEQIHSPSSLGELRCHALTLDWKRFVTYQTTEFMKNEIIPLKEITPDIPVTTNFMGAYPGLDYSYMKDYIDVVSNDNYPVWHHYFGDDIIALKTAWIHDLDRCLMDKAFIMMESAPSNTNWTQVNKLKRPNMHKLSSMQAVAHGADSVLYFQWRMSRGGSEKFHGAVVDHSGSADTRVFRDVTSVGETLKKLDEIVGARTKSEVGIIFSWANMWTLDDFKGFNNNDRKYYDNIIANYRPFWDRGINVDVVTEGADFSKYKILIAPMLHLMTGETVQKLEEYVANGGRLIMTYLSGMVNENALCYLGGFPANNLKKVFGIWAEEVDAIYDTDEVYVKTVDGKKVRAYDFCEVIRPQGATTLATYCDEYYKGTPAVTENSFGKGKAYYIAFRDKGVYADMLYGRLIDELKIEKNLDADLPNGVTAHSRESESAKYIFVENYNADKKEVCLDREYIDVETGEKVSGKLLLDGYGVRILKADKE